MATVGTERHPAVLRREDTGLIVVDVQEAFRPVIDAFDDGRVIHAGDDVPANDYAELVGSVAALRAPVNQLTGGDERPAAVASAVEFILEGLHLSKRLNKDAAGARATYRSRG